MESYSTLCIHARYNFDAFVSEVGLEVSSRSRDPSYLSTIVPQIYESKLYSRNYNDRFLSCRSVELNYELKLNFNRIKIS